MGIKHCEYIDPDVINQNHNEVDFDSNNWIESDYKQVENSKKSKTYTYV